MSIDALYWALLAALGAWCARMQWWITQHHKSCHSEPGEAIARLETRIDAAEQESARLARNAHEDRSHLSAVVLDVALMKRGGR